MEQFTGKSVVKGIATGKVYVFDKRENKPEKKTITDIESEIRRFHHARSEAMDQLASIYEEAVARVGEENAMIFDMHKMMLEDLDYIEGIENRIKEESVNAEYAVALTGMEFSEVFASMDDEYMKARSTDVLDISARVIRVLEGRPEAGLHAQEPVILLAEDLTPSETIAMDKTKILAFVLTGGSTNSHTAILARSLDIPSLVGTNLELNDGFHGKTGIVDGTEGTFVVDPDDQLLEEMQAREKEFKERKERLQLLKGQENITKDGRMINLYANMGNVEDVDSVLANDAGGIGLFRSEFLYLGREDFPTEEEQFEAYKTVVSRMEGKKVIIRTLDIGADKKVDYFKLAPEDNPALGYRAIRICLRQEEIFRTQLRAIYRASAFGTVSIMFPMITSVWEIKKIKEIVDQVKEELTKEGISFSNVELGIMVETPAAAVISDLLAKEVDFFSIGTNDLTQYTLAIDRQNQSLDEFYDAHHESVLRLIDMTVKNGHREGIWVGICGELGADETLTETFLNMGVDELSVSPACVLKIRDIVRNIG